MTSSGANWKIEKKTLCDKNIIFYVPLMTYLRYKNIELHFNTNVHMECCLEFCFVVFVMFVKNLHLDLK